MRPWVLFCAAILGTATSASADSFSISLLDTSYSVTLRDQTYQGGAISETYRTSTDTAPVNAEYLVTAPSPYNFVEGGTGSADLFGISTWTSQGKSRGQDGNLDHMWAYATSAMTFAPLVSGTTPIEVSFLLGGMALYSESMVRLEDLTTSTDLWTLGWAYRDDPTMQALSSAPTVFSTAFDASHTYQLTLYGWTDARDDSQSLTARVDGLQTVPEPSTLLLLGVGAGAATLRRKRGSAGE